MFLTTESKHLHNLFIFSTNTDTIVYKSNITIMELKQRILLVYLSFAGISLAHNINIDININIRKNIGEIKDNVKDDKGEYYNNDRINPDRRRLDVYNKEEKDIEKELTTRIITFLLSRKSKSGSNDYSIHLETKSFLHQQIDKILNKEGQPWSNYPKDKEFGLIFTKNFKPSVQIISHLLKSLKQTEDFKEAVTYLIDSPLINTRVVKFAVRQALIRRNDTSKNIPTGFDINPELFMDLHKENSRSNDYMERLPEITIEVPTDFNFLPEGNPENEVNYWREDILLHFFHDLWHAVVGFEGTYADERYRELFIYMHRQFLKRYVLEREALNLSNFACLTPERIKEPFGSEYKAYFKQPDYKTGVRLSGGRHSNCTLSREKIYELQESLQDLNKNWNTSPEFFYGKLEDDYHAAGHMAMRECTPKDYYSVMEDPTTSARDPIFYQWHCEVNRVADLYKSNLPVYSKNDLEFEGNLEVSDFYVTTTGGRRQRNLIKTYMEDGTIYHAGQFTVEYLRLNHEPFTFNVVVENSEEKHDKVMIRIFLGHRRVENWQNTMVEMDRFVHKLRGVKKEIILRKSFESQLTMKSRTRNLRDMDDDFFESSHTGEIPESFCGFPDNLYVPRGRRKGENNSYTILAFVNDIPQNVNEGEGEYRGKPHMLCGSYFEDTVFDKRSFGFPFDRKWNLSWEENIKSSHETSINIQFEGYRNQKEKERQIWIRRRLDRIKNRRREKMRKGTSL